MSERQDRTYSNNYFYADHRMGICPNMDLDKDFGQCSKDEDCVDERMKCCSTVCLIPEVEGNLRP